MSKPPEAHRRTAARGVAVATIGLLVAVLVTALFAAVARGAGQRLLSPLPATPADVLLCALAVTGAALTAWWGLGIVTAALSVLPGATGRACRAVADRVAPEALRRAVSVLLGTALVASFAPGAALGSPSDPSRPSSSTGTATTTSLLAAPGPDLVPSTSSDAPDPSLRPAPRASTTTPTTTSPTTTSSGLGPLGPAPGRSALAPAERPVGLSAVGVPGAPAVRGSKAEFVVVRAGDTLWDIAAASLGTDTSTASIAAEWQRWYSVNVVVIGDDPDLLQPGQRLVAPSPLHVGTNGASS